MLLNRLGDAACYGTSEGNLRTLIVLIANYEPEMRPAEPVINNGEQHVVLPREWRKPAAVPA